MGLVLEESGEMVRWLKRGKFICGIGVSVERFRGWGHVDHFQRRSCLYLLFLFFPSFFISILPFSINTLGMYKPAVLQLLPDHPHLLPHIPPGRLLPIHHPLLPSFPTPSPTFHQTLRPLRKHQRIDTLRQPAPLHKQTRQYPLITPTRTQHILQVECQFGFSEGDVSFGFSVVRGVNIIAVVVCGVDFHEVGEDEVEIVEGFVDGDGGSAGEVFPLAVAAGEFYEVEFELFVGVV